MDVEGNSQRSSFPFLFSFQLRFKDFMLMDMEMEIILFDNAMERECFVKET